MPVTGLRARRRLLILTPFPPQIDGRHGGSRSIARLLEQLTIRHDVALICLRRRREPPVDKALRERLTVVEEVVHPADDQPTSEVGARAPDVVRFVRGEPRWVREFSSTLMRRRVLELVRLWPPDVVQVEYPVMMQYAGSVQRATPLVLVEYDPAVRAARDVAAGEKGIRKLSAHADVLAWKRFERRALQRASAVVVFNERDAATVRKLRKATRIARIPIAPSLWGPLDAVGREPPTVLFVGSFIHGPNVDAAERLACDIFPALAAEHPRVALVLVGHAAPPRVRALAAERISLHEDVPDVVPYLDEAAVVVAPMRTGGGMRVKVLDALAAGKALVASARAVEGLDVVPDEHFALAETDEQFVRTIARLLGDPPRRASLGAAAHRWARANLSWERTARAFEQLYERLIFDATTRGVRGPSSHANRHG